MQELIDEYRGYLVLERRMSANSVEAYLRDIGKFVSFLSSGSSKAVDLLAVEHRDIEAFVSSIYDSGAQRSSQARTISGIKSFYQYLYTYDKISKLPTELIETPKLSRKLPSVLSLEQVRALVGSIDMSQPQAHRNRAIIELLYSCGLRVSELTDLRMGDLFFNDNYIRVLGKGDKQRLIPISDYAISKLGVYIDERNRLFSKGDDDHLFLGRRGGKLTRVMIFIIVRDLAQRAGIKVGVTPHTLRHTFATHLVKGGADIRLVQMMLGHESITTTDIYTHLDSSYIKECIERYHPLATLARVED